MGLSKAKQYQLADGIGKAYAEHVFKYFLKRSPENLLREAQEHAVVHAFMYFPHKIKEDVTNRIRLAAKNRMEELLACSVKDEEKS